MGLRAQVDPIFLRKHMSLRCVHLPALRTSSPIVKRALRQLGSNAVAFRGLRAGSVTACAITRFTATVSLVPTAPLQAARSRIGAGVVPNVSSPTVAGSRTRHRAPLKHNGQRWRALAVRDYKSRALPTELRWRTGSYLSDAGLDPVRWSLGPVACPAPRGRRPKDAG